MFLFLVEATTWVVVALGVFMIFMMCLTAFSWILKSVLKQMKLLSEFAHFVRYRILLRRIEKHKKSVN